MKMMTGEKNDYDSAKVWKEAREAMITVARDRRTISYSELTQEIKSYRFKANSPPFFQLLCDISREEHKEGRGMLSAVVVGKDSGRPSPGFFKFAKKLGRDIDKDKFWEDERHRVYAAHSGGSEEPLIKLLNAR